MSTQVHFRMADAGGRDDLARLVRLRDGAARRVAGEQPAKAGGRAGLGVTLRERRLRLPAPAPARAGGRPRPVQGLSTSW